MFKSKFYASLRVDEGVPLQAFDLESLRSTEDDNYIRHINVCDNLGCLIFGKFATKVVSNGYPAKITEVDSSTVPGFVFAWDENSADSFWMARVNPLNPYPQFADECHRYLALKFDNCSPAEKFSEFQNWKKNVDDVICTWFDFIQYKTWNEEPPIAKFMTACGNEYDNEEIAFSRLHKIVLYSKRDFTMKSVRDSNDRIANLQQQIRKLLTLGCLTGGSTGVLSSYLDQYANIGDSLSFYSLLDSEQLYCLGW